MYQSVPKALFWLFYYWLDDYRVVRPARREGTLIVSHRSLIDALVDARRYRYGGPKWLLRWVVRMLPAPDLVCVLDAPPDVIQTRKQEVPLGETARQCAAYRGLAVTIPNGYLVDAGQPARKVAADVADIILRHAARRTARELRA